MSDPTLIEELKVARKLVGVLASEGANNWRMSVPPEPTDTDIMLASALDKAIAALEAKSEPDAMCETCGKPSMNVWPKCYSCAHKGPATPQCGDCNLLEFDKCPEHKEPAKPMAERVTETIVRDICESDTANPDHPDAVCILVDDLTAIVHRGVATITAEHEAQLADLRQQLCDSKDWERNTASENVRLIKELQETIESRDSNGRACDKLIKRLDREGVNVRQLQKDRDHYAIELTNSLHRESEAEAKGRREALAEVPMRAFEWVLADLQFQYSTYRSEAGTSTNPEWLRKKYETAAGEYRARIDSLARLIESARAAQENQPEETK